MEKISWIGRVKNEVPSIIKGRKSNLVGHILHRSCFLKHVTEGKKRGEGEEEDVSNYW
jgi:hypothetical protein